MSIRRPFNVKQWIEDNRHLMKPPVGNRNLYAEAGDYIVMMVAGPNARKDYHYNETEELFYQLEGDVFVKIQEDGKSVELTIKEGEMFLLPANTPHSPIRPEGTMGLVIEVKRADREMKDGLLWFCENCNTKLHEVFFQLGDIVTQLHLVLSEFYNSTDLCTCKNCGTVMQAPIAK